MWDVTTQDLCSGSATLDGFRGLVFVGGFSYGDVLGSAKGENWGLSSPPPGHPIADNGVGLGGSGGIEGDTVGFGVPLG